MKSKEEIEKLAKEYSSYQTEDIYGQHSIEWREGFVKGYQEGQKQAKDNLYKMYLEGFNRAVNQGNNLAFEEALMVMKKTTSQT